MASNKRPESPMRITIVLGWDSGGFIEFEKMSEGIWSSYWIPSKLIEPLMNALSIVLTKITPLVGHRIMIDNKK